MEKQTLELKMKYIKKNKNIEIYYSKYKPLDINKFNNKTIIAFSGIGNPTNFFDLLIENNLLLKEVFYYPDHYNFFKNRT